jgi:two-component system LytT family response regulator
MIQHQYSLFPQSAFPSFCCPLCGSSLLFIQQGHKITLPCAEGSYQVFVSDILRAEADGNYVHFYVVESYHTEEVKKYTVCCTLKAVEQMPTLIGFFRIHRSSIINLRMIKFRGGDGLLKLCYLKDTSLFVAPQRRNPLKAALAHWKL